MDSVDWWLRSGFYTNPNLPNETGNTEFFIGVTEWGLVTRSLANEWWNNNQIIPQNYGYIGGKDLV